MKWVEDRAFREWRCKQNNNIFSVLIRWHWGLEMYQVRICINILEPQPVLITEKYLGTLKAAKAFAKRTLQNIAAQATLLADSKNN